MVAQDKIILQGMKFYGYHGVLPEEKNLGQWFEVDLELLGPFTKVSVTDQVEDTLDYSQIYQEIRCLVEGESINLIETLAVKIADLALTYPLVEVVKVRVRKPQAPLGGPLDYAAVETVRSKKQ
ncbi:MAG: dihydroneopterin aldolase [Peptococcia bacterium]